MVIVNITMLDHEKSRKMSDVRVRMRDRERERKIE